MRMLGFITALLMLGGCTTQEFTAGRVISYSNGPLGECIKISQSQSGESFQQSYCSFIKFNQPGIGSHVNIVATYPFIGFNKLQVTYIKDK